MSVVIGTGFAGITYALDHPRIGWRRYEGTIGGTAGQTGFPLSAAYNENTFDAWKPTSVNGFWEITFPAARLVSYVGIGAHTCGSEGSGLLVQQSDGVGGWTTIPGTSHSPTDDSAVLFLFTPVTTTGIRVRVSGSVAEIGIIRVGQVTELPRKANWLGTPISESQQIEYRDNYSVTGEPLGRTVLGSGLQFGVKVENLPEAWRVSEWRAFRQHCETGDGLFFIAPKPVLYPDDVALAWQQEAASFEREKANFRISGTVDLRCRGYRAP